MASGCAICVGALFHLIVLRTCRARRSVRRTFTKARLSRLTAALRFVALLPHVTFPLLFLLQLLAEDGDIASPG